MNQALHQFKACVTTLYTGILNDQMFNQEEDTIQEWYAGFRSDLYKSKLGYPKTEVRKTAELEDRLRKIVEHSNAKDLKERATRPTLCLTHDIDYLKPTIQMKLKNLAGYQSWKSKSPDYMDSIKTLLKTDAEAAGRSGTATLFVASKWRASSLRQRWGQWVIDPAYELDDKLFEHLLDLFNEFECEIGLHGSFYSIQEGFLSEERKRLAERLRKNVKVGRQHWLHLPTSKPFETLSASGIQIDSTLGWNGNYGFRGGFSRPFPIVLENGNHLWEVPLVLMDGPLFQDLRFKTNQVVDKAIETLEQVFDRNGCVALNWHDRSATPEYGWFEAYSKLLYWAKNKGFEFSTISEAAGSFLPNGPLSS